ncbi:unnamed protein product [Prorocentrum cordatum]|uniref:Uncharacterized protein n=1 Tax=Prorocentrum cordatum TaxID=2364126 RepID=A0ABN9WQL0_9DINO|nr:unnamed protein product [Polarella glacialis]
MAALPTSAEMIGLDLSGVARATGGGMRCASSVCRARACGRRCKGLRLFLTGWESPGISVGKHRAGGAQSEKASASSVRYSGRSRRGLGCGALLQLAECNGLKLASLVLSKVALHRAGRHLKLPFVLDLPLVPTCSDAAGPRCQVVLSSTWRMPRHTRRARQVEAALSRHLGRYFTFDARTAIRDDSTPELRLQCIGDFAAEHCKKAPWLKKLRLLVLEDFHTTPFGAWRCGGQQMGSAGAVERHLRSRVPACVDASARLVHTYDEWTTDGGLFVQLGCGLTRVHFDRALDFLGALGDSGKAGVPRVPVAAKKDGVEVADADTHPATRKAQPPRESPDWAKMSDALAQAFLRSGIACVG